VTKRLYVLDLLRFTAALAVVGLHYVPSHPELWGSSVGAFDGVTPVFKYGWLGVEAFFVISGFVICMSSWGRPLSHFFVSRVTRLMPAYMCAVLITATVLLLVPLGRPRPHLSYVGVNLTMLQGFLHVKHLDNVYWTLFVELKFYLLFSIVVAFGVTYRRVVAFCLIWAVASLFAISSGSAFLRGLTEPRSAPLFIAGIVLYLIHRFGPDLLLWSLLATSIGVEAAGLAQRDEITTGRAAYGVALIVMFVIFAVMTAVALGWFDWVRWPGLVTLGALTYPLYLLHHEIGLVVIQGLHDSLPPWVLFADLVIVMLLLSFLVNRVVERRLGKALKTGLTRSLEKVRSAERPEPVRSAESAAAASAGNR
jgi:peptidoglycan/LPS O-acetylase OafA/YrhL